MRLLKNIALKEGNVGKSALNQPYYLKNRTKRVFSELIPNRTKPRFALREVPLNEVPLNEVILYVSFKRK